MEVKLDAFPSTRYGTINGELLHVSQHAIEEEKVGLIYSAKIRLLQTSVDTGAGRGSRDGDGGDGGSEGGEAADR